MTARSLAPLAPRTAWRALAWYALITVLMTWPLVPGLTRDIPWDLGDSLLNCWILAWNGERFLRLLGGDLSALHGFYDANIFHPQPLALAYSETLFAQTLQVLPVYAITKNLILCYNLLIFSSFALSGLGAFLLAREITGDWRAGFAAGLIFAFLPWRYAQMPHLQVLSTQWMPLALYALRRYFVTRRLTALAGAVAALVLNNHSNGYYLLFFAPAVAGYVLWEMASRGLLLDWRTWRGVGGAALATAALTVPFLLPYVWLRQATGEHRGLGEVVWFSADALAYATAHEQVHAWGRWMRALPRAEGDLFPGLVPVLLAITAVIMGWRRTRPPAASPRTTPSPARRATALVGGAALAVLLVYAAALLLLLTGHGGRTSLGPIDLKINSLTRVLWTMGAAAAVLIAASSRVRERLRRGWRSPITFFIVMTLIGFWLSLGPEPRAGGKLLNGPGLYALLYHHVPGFDGLRVPARFAVLVMLGLSMLAAFGVRDLVRRRTSPVVLAALGLLLLGESLAAPLPVNLVSADRVLPPPARVFPLAEAPAFYRAIARLPATAVLVELPFGDTTWELRYVYYSTVHWHPLVNGYSGGFPASYLRTRSFLDDPRRDPTGAWQALIDSGATHLALHEQAYDAAELMTLRRWLEAQGAHAVLRESASVLYELPR